MIIKLKEDKIAQTSVELILLIGSILIISLICGTYIYKLNQNITKEFTYTLDKGRSFLLNKI